MTALREKLARALFKVEWPKSKWADMDRLVIERYSLRADSVLATIEESGMVIVPREATEEMVEAGARQIVMVGDDWAQTKSSWDEMPDYGRDHWRDQARCSFPAMLAAAPKESAS